MLIQYLITFVGKTKQEILNNLDYFGAHGNILVGNQMCEIDSNETIVTKNYTVTIFNMKSKGVSKNRKFLLKHSSAEFITFLDDDMHFLVENQKEVANYLKQKSTYCVRFNVVSNNPSRPIKQLKKEGFIGFRKLTSYGVWGCFFRRQYLIDNSIFFDENIGPGTSINHGEDGLFLRCFTRKEKIYNVPLVVFTIDQIESTWHSDTNRDLKQELFSHGYLYYLLYGKTAIFMSAMFLITHKDCFPKKTNRFMLFKHMKSGICMSKKDTAKRKQIICEL